MDKIFLSYRREDSAAICGRIYDRLVSYFGAASVFKDVDSIGLGVDFITRIQGAIAESAVQLVIIGPHWLDIEDASGARRLDNPGDPVRLEIEDALTRAMPVIPLLVEGARMPTADQLPPSLRPVTRYNGWLVRNDPDFNHDMQKVRAEIEGRITAFSTERKQRAAEEQERSRQEAAEAARAKRQARRKARAMQWVTIAQATGSALRPLTARGGRGAFALLAGVLVVSIGLLLLIQRGGSSLSPTASATIAAFDTAVAATQTAADLHTMIAVNQTAAAATQLAIGTATIAAFYSQPYVAPQPGPCDPGGVSWQLFDKTHNGSPDQFPGTISCTADSMRIDGPAAVYCRGINQLFPLHYRVSVDVTPLATGDPGLGGEFEPSPQPQFGTSNPTQYAISIAANGAWYTRYGDFSPGGTMTEHTGQVPAAARYTLVMTLQNGNATFSINGAEVEQHQLTSATMYSTGISMAVGASNGGGDYRSFVITPLP